MDSHVLSALDFEPSVLASIVCAPGDHFRLMEKTGKTYGSTSLDSLSITNDKSIRSLAFSSSLPLFFFRFFFLFFFFFLPYVPLQFRDERGCNDHRRPVFGNEARWLDDVDLVCIQR